MHHVDKDIFIQRFIELDQKGYVWKDKVYQSLIEEMNLKLTCEELLEDYADSFQHHCIGYPGLIELLDYLKEMNIKLAIITNGFGRFQMNNIKGLRIHDYFDEILISEIEGVRKPDVEIFTRALTRLGIEPYEALFVGDHPVNDVEASIKSGMIGVWKEDEFYERPSYDECRSIKNLIEIKDILANLLQ